MNARLQSISLTHVIKSHINENRLASNLKFFNDVHWKKYLLYSLLHSFGAGVKHFTDRPCKTIKICISANQNYEYPSARGNKKV